VGQLLPLAPLPLAHAHFLVAHTRLVAAAGATFSYCVALQVSVGTHVRSEELVGAAVWYSLTAVHSVTRVQVRSDVAVCSLEMNWLPKHVVCEAHTRSELAVASAVWYSVCTQSVTGLHRRSLTSVLATCSHSFSTHTASALHSRSV
jgi:hypothetical protein